MASSTSYTTSITGAAFAANKSMICLYNASGSGRIVQVYRIWITNSQTGTVSGVITDLYLYSITSTSAGTNLTIDSYNPTTSGISTSISAKTGATDVASTADNLYRRIFLSTDEWGVGDTTIDGVETFHSVMNIWDSGYGETRVQPLTLREGQGIALKNVTSTVGTGDVQIEFTVLTSYTGSTSATFAGSLTAATFASNKSMATLFNASGSGKIIKLWRIWTLNNQLSPVSGILTNLELRRITNTSGGSSAQIIAHDTLSATLPSQITFTTGATDTFSDLLKTIVWSTDEPAVGGATLDEYQMIVPFNVIWDVGYGDSNVTPLVIREGEGITLKHSGSFSQGQCDIFFEFNVE